MTMVRNCKNCNAEVHLYYCPNCAHPVNIKRINGQYVLHEFKQVLNFEKGISFTIRELLIRPGENIKQFIAENRNRLVKPLVFILITSITYSLVNNLFQIEDGYVHYDAPENSTVSNIFNWVQNHYGYANIIMGVFIAFWTKLFFRKHHYNFYEILILLCFVMGMGMLIFSIFAIFEGLTQFDLMQVAGLIGIFYTSWAIAQFFGKKKIVNYVKALIAYILGMLSFTLVAVFTGTIIDLILSN